MSFDTQSKPTLNITNDVVAPQALGTRALSEWASRGALQRSGIPVVDGKLATSAEEAATIAAAFGTALALKINGADISHKTEIGGVELNVDPQDAARVFDELEARVKKHAPHAHPEGVIISPMVEGGIEMILGVIIDPVFGPAVMFGLGGIFVEVFQDVVFRLAPFDQSEAMKMIAEIKGIKLLQGVRGTPPSDIPALAEALVALSQFAAIHGDQLDSIDLNPFVVLPQGQGAIALDCLVVPKKQD